MRSEWTSLIGGNWSNGEPRNQSALVSPDSFDYRVKHVLVVDDEAAVRTMIADYLADQNIRVSTAANGREMERLLASGEIDLVILDLRLGEEDGFEIVR